MGITKIQAENSGGTLRFSARATIDPLLLVTMIEDRPDEFSLEGPYKLRFRWDLDNDAKRIDAAELLLTELGAKNEASAAA